MSPPNYRICIPSRTSTTSPVNMPSPLLRILFLATFLPLRYSSDCSCPQNKALSKIRETWGEEAAITHFYQLADSSSFYSIGESEEVLFLSVQVCLKRFSNKKIFINIYVTSFQDCCKDVPGSVAEHSELEQTSESLELKPAELEQVGLEKTAQLKRINNIRIRWPGVARTPTAPTTSTESRRS